jgi:hypothetical protein
MIIRELTAEGWYLYRPEVNVTDCRPEWPEQVDIVAWVREWWRDDAALMFHTANEGDIPAQYRQDQIKAGLLSGVPDLTFMRSGWRWPCGLIEMKRAWWKSKPSAEQRVFLSKAAADGKFSAVCNGADAAKCAFMDFKKGFEIAMPGDKVALRLIEWGGK